MKVVTFGEIMLRLAPEGYLRFLQSDRFEATFGGAEANVAVSLLNLGMNAAFVTKLPAHEMGQAAVNSLRKYGVDTSHIVRGGERVGIYYCEKGASQRASKVIYDRAYSSFATAEENEFDWNGIFQGADWFHFTGITPALSKSAASSCLKALQSAKEHGLTVSCDLNYRKKLWSGESAAKTLSGLLPYVDYLILNEEDAKSVFGIEAEHTNLEAGFINREGYGEVARKLLSRFPMKGVAITLRESISASDNHWSALFYTGGKAYLSKKYSVHIVDRVGGGDSFAAGLIYALLKGLPPDEGIEFAVAASCLKHSIEGDFNLVTESEVNALVNGNASGRVVR